MDKRKKKKTMILKWLFIVVFILLVVDKLLWIMEVGIGGRESLDSPNGRYVAGFNSLATGGLFATVGLSDHKRFYRFEIYDVNDKPKESSWRYTDRVKCVDLDVKHRKLNIGFEYIEWSPDSSEVTYAFKDIEFKLKIDEPRDEQKQ